MCAFIHDILGDSMNDKQLAVFNFLQDNGIAFDARIGQRATMFPGEQLPVELAQLTQDEILLLADLTKKKRVSEHDRVEAIRLARVNVSEKKIYSLLKPAWEYNLRAKLRQRLDCSLVRGAAMCTFEYYRHYESRQAMSAADLLYCLLSDSIAMYSTFENWCSDFGYSADSIAALKVYNACIDSWRKLATIFTPKELDQLSELLQDY